MALEALRSYPVRPAALRTLTIASNGIFRVDTESGERLVLRVSDPKSCHGPGETASEMAWLDALAKETDLGVPRPLRTIEGKLMTLVKTEGIPEPRLCQLFTWIPGPDLIERMTPENLRLLGVLTARLHLHAAGFVPPEGFHVRTLNRVFPYEVEGFPYAEPVVLFDAASREHMPPSRQAVVREAVTRVEEVLGDLYRSPAGLRVTHNDLHPWNVKVCRGRIYALDFEDLAWGYPVQDIATTFFYIERMEAAALLMQAYRAGYESLLPWPVTHPDQLRALIAGRDVMLANYLLCSRIPEDREALPGYLFRMEERLQRFLGGTTG